MCWAGFSRPCRPCRRWCRWRFLFAGTLLLLGGVILRLRQADGDFPQRLETAAKISVAGLGTLLGLLAMNGAKWDSGTLLFGGLFILALAGAVLILLPSLARRVVISLFVLFHFGGMVVAVTAVDPPNSAGPWLSKQLFHRVYRPYLSWLYLTNAYHFYSPDPGPPTLFWFAVKYSDGSYTWVKLPDRANSPIGMHYQRMLALPEHSFTSMARLPLSTSEYALEHIEVPERGTWEDIYRRRELGSMFLYRYPNPPKELANPEKGYPIPMVQGLDVVIQYREPSDIHKKVLSSVAKRILWNAPPAGPGLTAESVKVYRVVHQILSPAELAQGLSPLDKTKHAPFFLGEFDREGKMKDPLDPFLYWYLPITYVPHEYPKHGLALRADVPAIFVNVLKAKDGFLLDCLEMHAAGRLKKVPEENK